jgi:hypothetical protein
VAVTANKRFQQTQDDGAETKKRRADLVGNPMTPAEAAHVICSVHTRDGGARGFTIDWSTPNFVEIDGDRYWEAWRVLRELAREK